MFEIDKKLRQEFAKEVWARLRKPRPFFDFVGTSPYCSDRFIANKDDVICAVESCYHAGVPFRWMQRRSRELPPCLKELGQAIYEYFNKEPNTANTQTNFDGFHEHLCAFLMQKMQVYCPSFSYGNAQKLVNITFKYLTCCADYDRFKGRFAYCHLPVDRKILAILESRYEVEGVRHRTFEKTPWSKLNEDQYKSLCSAYRKVLDERKGEHSYLGVDFYFWKGISTFDDIGVKMVVDEAFYFKN